MATLMLDDEEFKSLEQILSRLAQVTSSIQSLRTDILKSNPLPTTYVQSRLPHPPQTSPLPDPGKKRPRQSSSTNSCRSTNRSSLQASAQIIQRNLQGLLDSLNDNAILLNRMVIHPSPSFPGRTQEGVLGQLLRKKLEPDVEELVARGREMGREAMATPEGLARMSDVWGDVRDWVQRRIAQYVGEEAEDVYTKEEREMGVENVRTGLKRNLEDDEDDDDDDDDDEDGDSGAGGGNKQQQQQQQQQQAIRGPEPETLLWFATRGDFGVLPNIKFERKENVYRGLQGINVPAQDEAMHSVSQQQQQQQQQQP
ncbi:hypothetical protein GMORB2_1554 [Geosmithia morbida]|uniref:Mediator of RNA polymerase II transcription subunit 8 n=1 Tax=Geosmithia morbida TaxID=1094350 RepID=A0A9P5D3E5_9HYPO|nr:uncharacterized protein GMORB2_1554 [Geosmithia morbida]KAF4121715.1 hypothetical protein GMORB2_1554 [Geosmithia morbida]